MPTHRDLIASAATALKERIEEVNRLNVFPVPDGDTGTNMSLTIEAVLGETAKLPDDATIGQICHSVTHGSLMGARGNSGVILSQILRGLCEGIGGAESFDAGILARALNRSTTVAFQAVRKPVEGTMLTVVKDAARAAQKAADEGASLSEAMERVAAEAFESVRRTPDLLAVLKDNGVVDAGGYGLALLAEGFVAAALGHKIVVADVSSPAAGFDSVMPADDWDDDEYLYCTEFLLFGESIDRENVHDYMTSVGGSELVVGDDGQFKIHVHTNDPGSVLAYVTALGEVADVHINNMRRQQAMRGGDPRSSIEPSSPPKAIGFVAVAVGTGLARILESVGVDVIVNGGQTMNPSTQDLLEAVGKVNAEKVIILPNNKNIIMAANAAASVAGERVAVVPTRSVPQAFSAMLAFEESDDIREVVEMMTKAAADVRTGEVTTAVKDAKGSTGDILAGQVIGILDDDEIAIVGTEVGEVAMGLARIFSEGGAESLLLLAGEDLGDEDLSELAARMEKEFAGVAVETHRGDQPLYPVILSAE
jgi:DAK2 domain fusion protein YloV